MSWLNFRATHILVEPGVYYYLEKLTPLQVFVARAVSGTISKTAVAPLDAIQTLNQVGSRKVLKKNLLEEGGQIYKKEGIYGFFKGNLMGCIRLVTAGAIQVFLYIGCKKLVLSGSKEMSSSSIFVCTSLSAIAASLVTYPFEVIKTRLIMDSNHTKYSGAVDCFNMTVKEEGWMSLWNGCIPYVLGNLISEEILDTVWLRSVPLDEIVITSGGAVLATSPLQSFLTSCLAAAAAQAFYYPIDTVVKMVQASGITAPEDKKPDVEFVDTFDAAIQTAKKHGPLTFYRGFGVNLLKVVPGVLIAYMSYEFVKAFFANYNAIGSIGKALALVLGLKR